MIVDLSLEEIDIRNGETTGELKRYLIQRKETDAVWETVFETREIPEAVIARDERMKADPERPVRIVLYSVRTEALET